MLSSETIVSYGLQIVGHEQADSQIHDQGSVCEARELGRQLREVEAAHARADAADLQGAAAEAIGTRDLAAVEPG